MTMTITGHQKVMKEDSRAYGRFALNTQNPSSSMPDSPDQPRRMGTNEMIPGHIQAAKIIPRADLVFMK